MYQSERNIYIVNQHYYPELASTGQVFQEIAEHYQKNGYRVTVIAGKPFYHDHDIDNPPAEQVINDVAVKRLWNTAFHKASFVGKLFNLLTFQISLLFFLLFSLPAGSLIMVGTNPPMAIMSVTKLKHIKKFRVIFVVQDLYPDILISSNLIKEIDFKYILLKALMKKSFHLSDTIITISHDMKTRIEANYGCKNVVLICNWSIGNIYPLDNMLLKSNKGWDGKFVVQYSGNFGIAHEYETLLSSVRKLKSKDDILFYIVGGGVNFNKLKTICEKEGLKNIVFSNYVSKEELNENLNISDISLVVFNDDFKHVLLPSKYYGLLACAKPILLISNGENDISRDIHAYNTGFFIQSGHSDELINVIIQLSGNRELIGVLSQNAYALFREKYQKEKILAQYLEVVKKYE